LHFVSPLLIIINQENLNVLKLLLSEIERLGRYYSRTVGRYYTPNYFGFNLTKIGLIKYEQIYMVIYPKNK
tara:strand:- start:73 stop:285 length:213 start_codon:yes stop_codon:yes gene_type:complete